MENKALNRVDVGRAAQAACLLEVISPKPGNVNRSFDFSDTTLADFMMSAVMIGRCMEEAQLNPVGETVKRAVQDTRRMVPRNTNLGIILLFTPLAKAYGEGELRQSVQRVLESLTIEDAQEVYGAIRMASPGGLGKAPTYDVTDNVDITLLESMSLARERDAIAREYVTDFAITFELGWPSLESFLKEGYDFSAAVVQTYLTILAEVPDTLIARKKDMQEALDISRRAAEVLRAGGISSAGGREEIQKLDAYLRLDGNTLNPGTTADLTAAAIFVFLLQNDLDAWHKARMT
jgi:triphosphoribosyl-dephospho-CoA synthase